jgi:transcriptional regulator with XRE-family HTH domain
MFGRVVHAHRRRLGLTQEELAGTAGIGLRTLRDIETGRIARPRQATVRRLAAAFELAGPDRARFHELAAPAAAPGHEYSELLTLRQEMRRLAAENEVLRRASPGAAREDPVP